MGANRDNVEKLRNIPKEQLSSDGLIYGIKDGTWVEVTGGSTPKTDTPTLHSDVSVINEGASFDVTITNYSATATYIIAITDAIASYTKSTDTITITGKEVDANELGELQVSASESAEVTSDMATLVFTVNDIPNTEDPLPAIVYDSATMTEFTSHTNTQLADTNTTLEATAPDGFAISNVITNDVDITGLITSTEGNEPFEAKFEFTNISEGSTTDTLNTTTPIAMVIILSL